MTSSVQLRRCVDESKSDVINTVGVPQIQYSDRAVDILVVRGRWCLPFSREACVCVCVPEACDVTSVKVELDPWIGNRGSE